MAVEIGQLGGNCPVQAEGSFDGVAFYFRARYSRWECEVGINPPTYPISADNWYYDEQYGDEIIEPYSAGWMSEDEARVFINQAYERWINRNIPECCGFDWRKAHATIGEGEDGKLHRKGCPNGPKCKQVG